jgi:hypothetical protein
MQAPERSLCLPLGPLRHGVRYAAALRRMVAAQALGREFGDSGVRVSGDDTGRRESTPHSVSLELSKGNVGLK